MAIAQKNLRVIEGGRRCPICRKPTVTEFRPFCSKRCADIDMGRWLKEAYVVPSQDAPDSSEEDEGGAADNPQKPG